MLPNDIATVAMLASSFITASKAFMDYANSAFDLKENIEKGSKKKQELDDLLDSMMDNAELLEERIRFLEKKQGMVTDITFNLSRSLQETSEVSEKFRELLEDSEIELGDYAELEDDSSETPYICFIFTDEPISQFAAFKVQEELKSILKEMGPGFDIIGSPEIGYE